jgi:gliding motility-associated-like protein
MFHKRNKAKIITKFNHSPVENQPPDIKFDMIPPKIPFRLLSIVLFLGLATFHADAQPTTQDCLGAIPVCGTSVISSGLITGTGTVTNEINPLNSCLLTGERNDTWYLINVGSTGLLHFSVVPNNLTENYNWAVYNLTNASCSAIFTNPALEIDCNYSNLPGITGANGLPGLQNQAPIPVSAGQILVINVSAFSSINQSGYTLDLTGSTFGPVDVIAPTLTSVSAMNCGATSIGVTFSEMIDCSTALPSSFQLTGPGGPYTISAVTAVNCSAGGTGSKSFTVSFTPALSASGTYSLSLVNPLSDLCGNTTPMPQSFSFPISAMSVNFTQTNVTCFGGNNGSLTANVTGSSSPFTYQWSPSGGNMATAQFLTAGTYTVTVTNSGGCTTSASATITQPLSGLTATSVVTASSGCAANGSATVTVSNGQAPFIYAWWPTGGNAATATGLTAGGYMVTITDANQCVLNYFLNIPSASGPSASILSSMDVSCFGGNDGSATVGISGSSGPFTYQWSPSGGNAATASGLTAGNYTVTVTINSNCVLSASVVISEPPTALSATVATTGTTCGSSNGTIQLSTSGSVPPYNYSWSPGVSTGSSASGLNPGTYTITVSDANGCTVIKTVVIPASANPVLSITNHTNVNCNGASTGSTGVLVNGGLSPYSYNWSGGQTTASLNAVPAGTYTVTVTDAAGCTAVITDIITQPAPLNLSLASAQQIACFGESTGAASFSASGGTLPYTWQWSGNSSSSPSATALAAGTYTVTVTDQNSCSVQNSVTISQPSGPVIVQATITNTACGNTNGSVVLAVSGGTGSYSYLWSTGSSGAAITNIGAGLYSVTITDQNGCSVNDTYAVQSSGAPMVTISSLTDVSCFGGSNGTVVLTATGGVQPYVWSWSGGVASGSTATGLVAGNYTATITDASGCQSFQLISIFEPTALTVTIPPTNPICQGGTTILSALAQGGTSPFQYQWNTGSAASSITVMPVSATLYSVTVVDANGCTAVPAITQVTVALPLSLTATYPASVCEGTQVQVQLTASGGDGSYSYQWSNGMSGASNFVTVTNPLQFTTTVTDGCGSPQAQVQVTIAMVTAPVLNVSLDPQKGCQPFTAFFAIPNGPQPGISYRWDFGDGTFSTQSSTSHQYTIPGVFFVSLSAFPSGAPSCSTLVNFTAPVTVLPVPEARFAYTPQIPTVNQPEVRFDDRSYLASSWRWSFGDNSPEENIPDPVHTYRGSGTYPVRLDVATTEGCTDSAVQVVEVVEEMQFYIPNAFTADDNGVNDAFQVVGIGYTSYEVQIFDRWGKMVHESRNGSAAWDGNDSKTGSVLPQGLYICKITMHDTRGNSITKFSHVTLLR